MYIDIKIKTFELYYTNEETIISLSIFKRVISFTIEKQMNGLSALFG